MSDANRFLFFLVWIFLLQLIGLGIFSQGFFLTRIELPDQSSCEISSLLNPDEISLISPESLTGDIKACWLPSRYKRAIWVVIDALRFDFAQWVDDGALSGPTSFYHNKLPILHEMLEIGLMKDASHRAFLYKFEADPPTVTMQRLKGLTTGGLPTFIDFRQNFHSPEILEDNWVNQLNLTGKKAVFMGDDTWQSLFPGKFSRNFPFPSFNTRDLHTVDNGILKKLPLELAQKDWDILIVHFLGVDHVGHTYGPATQVMADKLLQMDSALRTIFTAARDLDAIVFIMGDHGMTNDGNHGGATTDETEAALYVYARNVKNLHPSKHNSLSGYNENVVKKVAQIDLVPTLSLLTGLSIPFGNLGGIIPELFLEHYLYERAENLEQYDIYGRLADALLINSMQVWRYLNAYSKAPGSSIPKKDILKLYDILEQAKQLHLHLSSNNRPNSTLSRRICSLYKEFLDGCIGLGRQLWTQYDEPKMYIGALLQFFAILCIFLEVCKLSEILSNNKKRKIWTFLLIILIVSVSFSTLFGRLTVDMSRIAFFAIFSAVTFIAMSLRSCFKIWCQYASLQSNHKYRLKFEDCFMIFISILYSVYVFGNSFIEVEHKIHLFFGISSLLVIGGFSPYSKLKRRGIFFSAILYRISFIDFQVLVQNTLLGTILVAVISVFAMYVLFKSTLSGYIQSTVYLAVLIAIGVYWILDITEVPLKPEKGSLFYIDHQILLPRFVYAICFFDIALSILFLKVLLPLMKRSYIDVYRWVAISVARNFSVLVLLLLGKSQALTVVATLYFAYTFKSYALEISISPLSVVWIICVRGSFFFTGHHNQFSRVQYDCAFIGFENFNLYVGGCLLFLNTFSFEILGVLFLPFLVDKTEKFMSLSLRILLFSSVRAFISMVNAIVQKRHLMLWAVFAPKFVFDSMMHVVVICSLIILWTLVLRANVIFEQKKYVGDLSKRFA